MTLSPCLLGLGALCHSLWSVISWFARFFCQSFRACEPYFKIQFCHMLEQPKQCKVANNSKNNANNNKAQELNTCVCAYVCVCVCMCVGQDMPEAWAAAGCVGERGHNSNDAPTNYLMLLDISSRCHAYLTCKQARARHILGGEGRHRFARVPDTHTVCVYVDRAGLRLSHSVKFALMLLITAARPADSS